MQSKEIVMRVGELAAKICGELGLTLWDVLFEKEGRDHVLTVFIDRASGVSIDDCEAVSRALDGPLDEPAFDSLPAYTLSVSSPGIERRLRTPEHFAWAQGKAIDVGLFQPQYGAKEHTGRLLSFDAQTDALTIENEQGVLTFQRGEYARAGIHFDF